MHKKKKNPDVATSFLTHGNEQLSFLSKFLHSYNIYNDENSNKKHSDNGYYSTFPDKDEDDGEEKELFVSSWLVDFSQKWSQENHEQAFVCLNTSVCIMFRNARSIKNIVNRACFRLASRVMTQSSSFTYKTLIEINASDLILSTLFLKGLRIFPMTKITSLSENGNSIMVFQ